MCPTTPASSAPRHGVGTSFGAFGLALAAIGLVAAWWLGSSAPAGAAPPKDPSAAAAARTPYGEMNLAWAEPGMIGLVGWAKDPDVDRPIDVVVGITDGGGLVRRTAGVFNPYLPGSYAQKFRSYLIAVPVSPGPKTMCVAALNVGKGNPSRLLGCQSFVVPSADPIGVVESVVADPAGDAVRVAGWTVDPESSASLAVDVFVDGVITRIGSSLARPDVAAAVPGKGTAHGFSASVPASVGRHRVCVLARNTGRGGDVFLDCRDVVVPATVPIGSLDLVTGGPGGVRVVGWAADADAASTSIRVAHQLVDDIGDASVALRPAAVPRPDVAATTGLSSTAGFDAAVTVSEPGRYRVCVDAVNVGPGRDRRLGCGEVTVEDRRPLTSLDTFALAGNAVRIGGWAADRAGAPPVPVTVRVAVDGNVTSTQVAAIARPDVAAAVPGTRGDTGFDLTVGLSAGSHQVCVTYSGSAGPLVGAVAGQKADACASVVIGPPSFLVVSPPGLGDVVGPTSGPLVDVDRDAGVSTRLRDGSVLWLFGDSTARNADGSLRYFVSGTGALAANGRPSNTLDAVAPGGAPYVLAAPGPAFPGCTLAGARPALWPMSAVTVPVGSLDRVVVFLANMCLVDQNTFEFRGVAVGEWFYDPADPGFGRPVQLALVNQQMGMARNWGTAAAMGDDGWLYVYQCDRPANPANLGGYGPCRAARVDPVTVGEPATYRYWNGSTWVASDPNVAMTMPAGTATGYRYPASSLTVHRVDGGYAMAYSPWPGFVDRLALRFSRTPVGPWTAPLEIQLPGCSDTVGGVLNSCYAVTLQPSAGSSPTSTIGIGWYDQISAPERRGRYRMANLSVSASGW